MVIADERPAPEESARWAGLRYVHEGEPGIRRRRRGKGFSYHDAHGRAVRDPATLARIRSLAIPPAYGDVWVCADPDGHLQATGRDARGRKQYRYHPHWNDARHAARFGRLAAFALALPGLRARTDADLALPGLPREKVLAAVIRLLELTHVRVGNTEYARQNHSYGLTTLLDRHAAVEVAIVSFRFRGKSGVRHSIRVADRRLARVVRRCQELPGQELFQYAGTASGDFTAKDFRTWAGTVLAAETLRALPPFTSQTEAKRQATQAIERVAGHLGNTKAVCRKHYVHPAVLAEFLAGTLADSLGAGPPAELLPALEGLPPAEAAVAAFLHRQAAFTRTTGPACST
jgi:DNA topoisomerase-1